MVAPAAARAEDLPAAMASIRRSIQEQGLQQLAECCGGFVDHGFASPADLELCAWSAGQEKSFLAVAVPGAYTA